MLTANPALEGILSNACFSKLDESRVSPETKERPHGADTNYTGQEMELIDFTPNFKLVAYHL